MARDAAVCNVSEQKGD